MPRPFYALIVVCIVATVGCSAAEAGPFRDRVRQGLMERAGADETLGGTVMAYGADPLQKLRFWKGAGPNAPLVVFVHGGGWRMGSKENATGRAKVEHLTGEGYAFASLDYRLVPAVEVEEQARDVSAGLAYLIRHATRLGIDPHRIVLMGHSAGAHLVALVGTDPHWLGEQGLSLNAVRGVVAVDGAAYDVLDQIESGPQIMRDVYGQAFGDDPERQRALSPTHHAGAPNAPAFLLLHVQRPDGIQQTNALADVLRKAGTDVTVRGFPGQGLQGHMEINRRLGEADYPATAILDGWLAKTTMPR